MSDVTVYVAYHKNAPIVHSSIYRPIHVGKALSVSDIEGTIGDNTGENISTKNPLYCEMTAAYWAWKNDKDSRYIGLCHYRRLFCARKPNIFRKLKLRLNCLKEKLRGFIRPGSGNSICDLVSNPSAERFEELRKDFERKIEKWTASGRVAAFGVKPVCFASRSVKMRFDILGEYHTQVIEDILEQKYPQMLDDYKKVMLSDRMSYANMSIMRRDVFDRYCSMVFDVLVAYESRVLQDRWCSDLYVDRCFSRLPGYMAELLTATFLEHLKRSNESVKELTVVTYGV